MMSQYWLLLFLVLLTLLMWHPSIKTFLKTDTSHGSGCCWNSGWWGMCIFKWTMLFLCWLGAAMTGWGGGHKDIPWRGRLAHGPHWCIIIRISWWFPRGQHIRFCCSTRSWDNVCKHNWWYVRWACPVSATLPAYSEMDSELTTILPRIIKAYIAYHLCRNSKWLPKIVNHETPKHICEFIIQKCGLKEKGFEGWKVTLSTSILNGTSLRVFH